MYRILQCTAHCSTAAAELNVQCTVYSTPAHHHPAAEGTRERQTQAAAGCINTYPNISTLRCTMLADTAAPDQEEEVGCVLQCCSAAVLTLARIAGDRGRLGAPALPPVPQAPQPRRVPAGPGQQDRAEGFRPR